MFNTSFLFLNFLLSFQTDMDLTKVSVLQVLVLVPTLVIVSSQDDSMQAISDIIAASHADCRRELNPGMAIAIVKGGRTLLSRGFGVTSLHGNIPVTSSTRFNVASLTKALTAALLLKVMEESGRWAPRVFLYFSVFPPFVHFVWDSSFVSDFSSGRQENTDGNVEKESGS